MNSTARPTHLPPLGADERNETISGRADATVRLSNSTRTEAFSDGVLAITITLLVLDIGRPAANPGRLFAALLDQWPTYLAFVASFVYVGVVWMNHHTLFSRILRVDRGLQWLNLGILMTAALLPFPTAVLAEAFAAGDATNRQIAVGLYALVAGLMLAAWLPLAPYLRGHPYLLVDETAAAPSGTPQLLPWVGLVLYAAAAVLGIFAPIASLVLFLVIVVLYAVTSEGLRPGPRTGGVGGGVAERHPQPALAAVAVREEGTM